MNYNKKRMIVALHLTVSSVMLLSGFTSPGTKMNTAGDLRYAGGEIAVQIGDSVVDGTISMIKGTKQVSQSVQTAGDVWKTEAVRIEEMIRAEEERAAEEARIAEEQAAQAAALEATQLEAANVMAGEQELLAALIYCEAGNQPYEGQVAVGAVVMNRVRSGSYPNTISEVIYQSGQFGYNFRVFMGEPKGRCPLTLPKGFRPSGLAFARLRCARFLAMPACLLGKQWRAPLYSAFRIRAKGREVPCLRELPRPIAHLS